MNSIVIIIYIFSSLIPIASILSQCIGKHKIFTGGRIITSILSIFEGFAQYGFVDTMISASQFEEYKLYKYITIIFIPISIILIGLVIYIQQDFKYSKKGRYIYIPISFIYVVILIATALIIGLDQLKYLHYGPEY